MDHTVDKIFNLKISETPQQQTYWSAYFAGSHEKPNKIYNEETGKWDEVVYK